MVSMAGRGGERDNSAKFRLHNGGEIGDAREREREREVDPVRN